MRQTEFENILKDHEKRIKELEDRVFQVPIPRQKEVIAPIDTKKEEKQSQPKMAVDSFDEQQDAIKKAKTKPIKKEKPKEGTGRTGFTNVRGSE